MSLAVLSPTSFNMQNWRFVLVKDPETRKQLRAAAWDQTSSYRFIGTHSGMC